MEENTPISAIWLTVRDLERSVAFYRDTLGLRPAAELPGIAHFACGQVALWLSPVPTPTAETAALHPPAGQETGATLPTPRADGDIGATPHPPVGAVADTTATPAPALGWAGGGALVLAVPTGIEARCQELAEQGVAFTAPLAETPLGRMAHLADPDGYRLCLWEPPTGSPASAAPPLSAQEMRRAQELLTLLRRAEDAKLLDHYDQAATCYRMILEAEPTSTLAWASLSYVLNQQGDYTSSLEASQHALALDPGMPEVWNNRGNAQSALGHQAEALAAFEQAITMAPATAEFVINKALALLNLGRHTESLATIDRALLLDERQAVAWSNRGWILAVLGRYEESLASVERALGLGLHAAGTLDTQGYALAGLGRYAEALACYERALAQAPRDPEILAHQAAAQRALEQTGNA